METFLVLIVGIFSLVLFAMAGLGVGILLRKKTPLKGSCSGTSCERGGPQENTCLCGEQKR